MTYFQAEAVSRGNEETNTREFIIELRQSSFLSLLPIKYIYKENPSIAKHFNKRKPYRDR